MLSFMFVHEDSLKTKAASNIKINLIFSSLYLNGVGVYLRVGTFSSGMRIVIFHPSNGTHWSHILADNFSIQMEEHHRGNYLSLL